MFPGNEPFQLRPFLGAGRAVHGDHTLIGSHEHGLRARPVHVSKQMRKTNGKQSWGTSFYLDVIWKQNGKEYLEDLKVIVDLLTWSVHKNMKRTVVTKCQKPWDGHRHRNNMAALCKSQIIPVIHVFSLTLSPPNTLSRLRAPKSRKGKIETK